jgi:hypothetical protein
MSTFERTRLRASKVTAADIWRQISKVISLAYFWGFGTIAAVFMIGAPWEIGADTLVKRGIMSSDAIGFFFWAGLLTFGMGSWVFMLRPKLWPWQGMPPGTVPLAVVSVCMFILSWAAKFVSMHH